MVGGGGRGTGWGGGDECLSVEGEQEQQLKPLFHSFLMTRGCLVRHGAVTESGRPGFKS
jgi:hypothetical protein